MSCKFCSVRANSFVSCHLARACTHLADTVIFVHMHNKFFATRWMSSGLKVYYTPLYACLDGGAVTFPVLQEGHIASHSPICRRTYAHTHDLTESQF